MKRSLHAAAIAVVAALTLSGCASNAIPDETSASTPSPTPEVTETVDTSPEPEETEPATGGDDASGAGLLLEGDGYSLSVPESWEDMSAFAGEDAAILDLMYGDVSGIDTAGTNINVIVSPGEIPVDMAESILPQQLEATGAENVVVQPRVDVDGVESGSVSANYSSDGFDTRQVYSSYEGDTYIITFTFLATTPEADREVLMSSILDSWRWS